MDEIRVEQGSEVKLVDSDLLDAAFEEKRKGLYLLGIEDLTVYCQEAGSGIDLGGIGKGFALDCLAGYLEEWELLGLSFTVGVVLYWHWMRPKELKDGRWVLVMRLAVIRCGSLVKP